MNRGTLKAFRAGCYERFERVKAATAELAMGRHASVADIFRAMTDREKAIWLTMQLGMNEQVAAECVEGWITGTRVSP